MYCFQKFLVQYLMVTAIFLKQKNSVNGFGMNLMKIPEDDVSQVICSMALLRKYFKSGEALSGSVLYMSLTTASTHTLKKLLEAIHDMDDFPWSVVIRDPKNFKTSADSTGVLHEKPQCYFVIIENLEDDDLEDIFEDWKITVNWNPLAQFVVYLASVEETDEEMTELMIEILLSFMNKKIYNVNVIGQSEESAYYYGKSVFPYHPDNNCGNRVITIETLDVCDYHLGEKTQDNDDEDFEGNDIDGEGDDDNGGGNDDNGGDNGDNGDDSVEDDDENRQNDENEGNVSDNGGAGGDENGTNGTEDNAGEDDDNVGNNDNNKDDKNGNNETSEVGDVEENKNNSNYGTDDVEADDDNGTSDTLNSDNTDDKEDEKSINEATDIGDTEENEDNKKEYYKEGQKMNTPTVKSDNEKNVEKIYNASVEGLYKKYSVKSLSINRKDGGNRIRNNPEIKHVPIKRKLRYAFKNKNDVKDKKADGKKNHDKAGKIPCNDDDVKKSWKHVKHMHYNKPRKGLSKSISKNYYKKRKNRLASKNKLQKRFIKHVSRRFDEFKEMPSSFPKFMRLETELHTDNSDSDSYNQTDNQPYFFFEEIFRALFLDKFPKDLSGCPLVAAYRPWEPYIFTETTETVQENSTESNSNVIHDYDKEPALPEEDGQNYVFNALSDYDTEVTLSREGNRGLNGIEYKLLQTIGERLHISIDLQVENSNLYHLFQKLIDGDIEMVIGGIDEDPSMSQYVSTTIPYHQDDLTWCVAKAQRSYSLFNFLASFSWVVWLVSFIYIIVATLTITWMKRVLRVRIKYLHGFFSIMFRVFGIIFNQSMPIVIKEKSLRLAFFSNFFLALIFINAYQSFLISTLTTPKSAYQISRVEEIYQKRMIIKGSVENVRHLNKDGEIFKYIRERFQMCYNIEECLMEAAENENIAVAVSRQHSFYNPRIPRSRLYCFDRNENLYVYLVTMLLPKKFHLLHKINPVIQHVIESGHMQKWARDLDMRRKILEERNHAQEDKFRSLTIGQVVGTFVFTGVLLGIALWALMLECCVYRLSTKRRRTRLKIVKYLHRKFMRA